ncbi:HSPB1-associated protein 1 isoform X2 [Ochlerotatus camptorhynchus]|uniref:HSPB1-associated protein 1 isoform X2 n=1 Tax=Ochlerotatus camptorhynchus TaxID=644619 RepID=UPI0031D181C9
MDPAVIRDLVLNVREPVVLRNVKIPWFCMDQPLSEWLSHLDDSNQSGEDGFLLDCGPRRNGRRPQWERTRGKIRKTMTEFYEEATGDGDYFRENWASYSYRYVNELPERCRRGVNFEGFGFPDVGEDVSFWIGSGGAHTPCHYDTYGCNIVVQVHGRKRWLLFPPEAKLKATRVPYEESSVYCEENLYSPEAYSRVIGVESEAFHVDLEPGMVLIVPPKWWHYVETMEFSLNFNTWIQLLPSISTTSREELQSTLEYLLNQQASGKRQRTNSTRHPSNYLSPKDLHHLLSTNENYVTPIRKLENYEFFQLMTENSRRYDPGMNRPSDDEEDNQRSTQVINRSCNPELIGMLKGCLNN